VAASVNASGAALLTYSAPSAVGTRTALRVMACYGGGLHTDISGVCELCVVSL
jgi:hypothetical protein